MSDISNLLIELASQIQGSVILPDAAEYDQARRVFYGGIDKRPAALVRVANAQDVSKTVLFAKQHKIELAIRSGGHSDSGHSTTNGGIVIDLRGMKKIELNEADETVWAETGLTAQELTDELDKHDFVLGFGDTGSVGIGGITLGGGVGFLARKFGLAIDNLLAAEIVTADGEVLNIDADNHPDLFWAIRGGGGNFGVATKFKYKLHKLPQAYGGMILMPATPEVLSGFMQLAVDAPDELSVIINAMPTFPMPGVSEDMVGKISIMGLVMYAGEPTEAEKVLAPIRALATPIVDMLKPMRYKEIFFPEDEDYSPTAVSKTMFMDRVDIDMAGTILAQLTKIEAPMRAVQLRPLGGAVARVPVDATAYAHRRSAIMMNVAAFYEGEADKPAKQKWIEETAKALLQEDTGMYVNFLGPDDADTLRNAYPGGTWDKLVDVKAKYDPENLFRLNHNIPSKS